MMDDDDTIETLLGPGQMPGTEVTHEIPVLITPEFQPLPAHLANDPILSMCLPHPTTVSLFEHEYGPDAPRMIPGRPLKGPRIRITARDHVLAAMAATVLLMGAGAYVMVESGWRADMPQSQESPDPGPMVTAELSPAPQSSTQDPLPDPVVTPIRHHIARGVLVVHVAPPSAPGTPEVHHAPPSVLVPPPSPEQPSPPPSSSPSPEPPTPSSSPTAPVIVITVPVPQSGPPSPTHSPDHSRNAWSR